MAVASDRVVAHGPDLVEVTKETSEKGFTPADTLTRFMSEVEHIFVL